MRFFSQPLKSAKTLVCIMVLASVATIAPAVEKSSVAGEFGAEADLEKVYQSKILAFWERHGKRRDFTGVHGMNIAAMVFPQPGRSDGIVIASGYGESFIKYREIVYDLWRMGYQVYILDHRGQGLSERLLKRSADAPSDPQAAKRLHDMGFVDDFDNFVTDLKTFVDHEAKPNNKRLFLLGHSMGGAIASLYLEKYGDDFSVAALSAPMHQPDLAPIPNSACWLLKLGPGKSYVWGHGPYLSREFDSVSELTSSRVRYEILKRGELDRHPEAQLGGPSFHWAYEACKAANHSIRDAGRIKVDVLLFQAGADRIVRDKGQQTFCERMNASRHRSCSLREIKGARHELLIEQDIYRDQVLGEMIAFFRQRDAGAARD